MAAEDYCATRRGGPRESRCRGGGGRRPIHTSDASVQITQANGVSASVEYRAEHAPALARAILEAVGLDPRTVFAGDLPELTTWA